MKRRLAAALVLAVQLLGAPAAIDAAGPGYAMSTVARYAVDPAGGEIVVTVEVAFTNTTPNPPGQLSGFDRVDLGLQDGASQVAAVDARGALTVDLVERDGVQVASVHPRARIRFSRSVAFTLTYHLVDGSAPGVRVRSEVIRFAAWGFGTSSQVTVELPGGYDARADGDPMVIDTSGALLRMASGPIPDPSTWLALVTATTQTDYAAPLTASVALAGGTVDLQVRAWSGDPTWGGRTLATLEAGLPRLEEAIGLPYPRVGRLMVSEVVGEEAGPDQGPLPAAELEVAFDADAFTLLHQAAHIWIGDQLAADRWIREGLASHEAANVAAALGEALPYDPAARASALAADAFPLLTWSIGSTISARDAFAYAASWAFVDRIARSVGEANVGRALRRVVAGIDAYDPVDADQLPSTGRYVAVDTRGFLDQLATVSGVDLGNSFGQVVLGADAGPELRARHLARDDYAALLEHAGGWGAPDSIRSAMAAWRFTEARAATAVASAWLTKRDELIGRVARAGLTPPGQLRRLYTANGGGTDAEAELAAERAVVDAYLDVQGRAAAKRGVLEAIGLFAADDPGRLLAAAGAAFERGDLQIAARTLDVAEVQLNRAAPNGVVRIASAVVLATVAFLLWAATTRRRGGRRYTGAG